MPGLEKEISPETFREAVDSYIAEYEARIKTCFIDDANPNKILDPYAIPSIHGFCREKMNKGYKSFLYGYEKDERYTECIQKLTGWIVDTYHRLSAIGVLKANWMNFYMKNMHDWRDKVDTQVSGKLNIMKVTDEDEGL